MTNQSEYSLRYNGGIMEQSEIQFYKELKRIAQELNLTVFPQVNLGSFVITTKTDEQKTQEEILKKSIDFVLVNEEFIVVCCIELNGGSHKTRAGKNRDYYKNKIFEELKIPLITREPQNVYNLEFTKNLTDEIRQYIK